MGVGVGDELTITPWRRDEYDQVGEGVGDPGGTPIDVTVVGITRRANDLAGRLGGTSIYRGRERGDPRSGVVDRGGWRCRRLRHRRRSDDHVRRFGRNGRPGGDRPLAGPVVAEPDRLAVRPGHPTDQSGTRSTSRRSACTSSRSSLKALAGLLFAGQAVARQSRREWVDAAVLDTLGMTRGSMVRATVLRATVMASAAVAVAAVVTIASSELGPIGIGRSAEPHPGITFDWFVLVIGLPLVAMAVLASALVPVATIRRQVDSDAAAGSSSRTLKALPASGVAGWAMTNSRRTGASRSARPSSVWRSPPPRESLPGRSDELRQPASRPGDTGRRGTRRSATSGSDSQQTPPVSGSRRSRDPGRRDPDVDDGCRGRSDLHRLRR